MPDVWIDEGRVDGATPASRKRRRSSPRPKIDPAELTNLVGARRSATLSARLEDAGAAYAAERYTAARRILRPLVVEVPDAASARELLGLTQYRLGNWKEAIRQLETFAELTHSTEQHPVLADCYRATRKWDRVDELWEELRDASPSAALVTEGRIVVAGSMADRGRLRDAIEELGRGWRWVKRPSDHHLRRGYALGDLYERAGEVPSARAHFVWVAQHDPDFADVALRLASLD